MLCKYAELLYRQPWKIKELAIEKKSVLIEIVLFALFTIYPTANVCSTASPLDTRILFTRIHFLPAGTYLYTKFKIRVSLSLSLSLSHYSFHEISFYFTLIRKNLYLFKHEFYSVLLEVTFLFFFFFFFFFFF